MNRKLLIFSLVLVLTVGLLIINSCSYESTDGEEELKVIDLVETITGESVSPRGFEVGVAGELYSDSLSALNTETGTYLGMIRHNVDTIVESLTAEVKKNNE